MDERFTTTAHWSQITDRARYFSHQARRFVHDRPLQAIALTIGVGYVLGKVLGGRDERADA